MLRRFPLLILFIAVFYQSAFPQYKTDKRLEAELHTLTDTFPGVAGVYVRNLKTNKEAAINADTIFPTASIIKVPILVGIFDKIGQTVFKYNLPLFYPLSRATKGSGLMQFFKGSSQPALLPGTP